MKRLIILLSLVALFLILPIVSAEKTLKMIEIPIGYVASASANTDYIQSITFNSPDGISQIISMEIIVRGDFPATTITNARVRQTGNATVFSCNPSSWITPSSIVNNYEIGFDCSSLANEYNAIEKTIDLGFRVNKASTNIRAYLKITYMNDPKGSLDISGTEYSPNDPATIFVQLKDSYGNAVQNGSCYLDVWYPANASNVHPYTLQDAPMLIALGDDGIYYYDLIAPSQLGVYMLSAKCSYSYNWQWFYPPEEMINYPVRQINSGTWQGTSEVLNSKEDMLYERCDGSIAQPCSANYTFNLSVYGVITNVTNINVYFSGQSDTNNRILTISYWNGTSFVNLTNTLTFSGTGSSVPSAYDEFLTNSIPISAINGSNTLKLRLLTPGSTRIFQNWLSIALLTSTGIIQDVKGSSEMHITNLSNATALETWRYSNRTLTDYNASGISSEVANYVWNSSNRSLTYTDNFASAVWSYNGTIVPNIIQTLVNNTWSYTGVLSNALANQIGNSVWSFNGNSSTFMVQTVVNSSWEYSARYVHGTILS